jgi:RNA polymerase sigma factor (sigma-70 family)
MRHKSERAQRPSGSFSNIVQLFTGQRLTTEEAQAALDALGAFIGSAAGRFHFQGQDLDDLQENVWLRASKRFPTTETETRQRGWLNKIIQHEAIRLAKRNKRHPVRGFDSLARKGEVLASRTEDPGRRMQQKEQVRIAAHVMQKLRASVPKPVYRAFVLHDVRTRPLREVAQVLDIAPKKVHYFCSCARQELKKILSKGERG